MKSTKLKNKTVKKTEKINLTSFKNKITKQVEKLDLEKIKNETKKHGLKATTTVLNFGTKVARIVGEKYKSNETKEKPTKQRKKINRIRKF